jgi:short subunit dehydrogenase-like uncharacterized protein
MSYRILLYGATGFSGRLIAELAARRWSNSVSGCTFELVLGARDKTRLRQLADRCNLEYRAFGLDRREDVLRHLDGVHLVINAAGPFALTAERLAKAAIEARCHYVDINGEVDVYKRLDDLGRIAEQRGVTLVCSAGHMSATSDLLLDRAFADLENRGFREPVTVRIAMSSVLHPSRGSLYTVLQSLREQVTLVREESPSRLVLWHAPVGAFQRTFDFGAGKQHPLDLRIASVANLVDTLTARVEAMRHKVRVNRIESYMETGDAARIAYRLGAMGSPLLALPCVGAVARFQASLLPEGPTAYKRLASRNLVVLQIEDAWRTPVIDWRLAGPNIYDVTADAVTKITECFCKDQLPRGLSGWCTPAEVLGPCVDPATMAPGIPLDGCSLERRATER